ncbi:B12-binding domain-containing radical SAM protein [bacterium]|nr:B12-binding domain-containing radical SAM protein [bacterium]MBU1752789.1 B12-binding domain-containing radical SAM protein [bacterium]
MSDVLCLNPRENKPTVSAFGGMPPLGLCWIAAVLEKNGYLVNILDLDWDNTCLESVIEAEHPKMVCLSGTSHTRFESFNLAKIIKEKDPSIVVCYGGCHATFTADDTLSHVNAIDIIVKGEGEYTVLDIAGVIIRNKGKLQDVMGISYRDGDKIVHNPSRPPITDLDSLPFPARHLLKMEYYRPKLEFLNVTSTLVMTSRGCPVNCSYCSASAMWGRRYTTRSPQNVADEVEMLIKEYGVEGIEFQDSTITLNRDHIEGLCDEFERRKLKFPWLCELRVNTVDKDLLRRMQKAGCYYIWFGLESASPQVLKKMKKGITIEQVENVINWAVELGIYTRVFITYGHIGETYEDAMTTWKFVQKHKNKITDLGSGTGILIYPGTMVEKYAYEIGCLPSNFSWATPYYNKDNEFLIIAPEIPVLIQPQFGYQELHELRNKEVSGKIWNIGEILKRMKTKEGRKGLQTIAKGMIKHNIFRALKKSGN